MPEQLQTSRLYNTAHELSRFPSVRIVGSLARNAYLAQTLTDIREDGTPRNINVLDLVENNYVTYGNSDQTYRGVPISTQFDRWVRHESDGVFLTHPNYPEKYRYEVESPEEVFQPVAVDIAGGKITTLAPEVIEKLNSFMGIDRTKDMKGRQDFSDWLDGHGRRVDPDLLRVFDNFEDTVRNDLGKSRKQRLQRLYHDRVPARLRGRIKITDRVPALSVLPVTKHSPYNPPDTK